MTEEPAAQRDYMRKLVAELGRDKTAVCVDYAKAEQDGLVSRRSNEYASAAQVYAEALWADGLRKSPAGISSGTSQSAGEKHDGGGVEEGVG